MILVVLADLGRLTRFSYTHPTATVEIAGMSVIFLLLHRPLLRQRGLLVCLRVHGSTSDAVGNLLFVMVAVMVNTMTNNHGYGYYYCCECYYFHGICCNRLDSELPGC